jgi:hypothetical protein|nr:MAG TPA: hypothetical protein [Caudoviricetes sp.]
MKTENVYRTKSLIEDFISIEEAEYSLREKHAIRVIVGGEEIKLFGNQAEAVRRVLMREYKAIKKSLCEELNEM